MKKYRFMLLFVSFLTLLGCSDSNIVITIEPETFTSGEEQVLRVSIIEKDRPLPQLEITAQLAMEKMDHGTLDIAFNEVSPGLYEGKVNFPMAGEWIADLSMIKDGKKLEKTVVIEVIEDKPIATINNQSITQQDLDFYGLINRMQIQMLREADQVRLKDEELEMALKYWDQRERELLDRNSLLTQIIRLRAVALLAEEKGYSASEEEITQELKKAQQMYEAYPSTIAMIKEYGEERFWDKQDTQFEMIVLAQRVQKDMIQSVEKANPNAAPKEIRFLAEKQYEDLLVSQMGSLEIRFYNE